MATVAEQPGSDKLIDIAWHAAHKSAAGQAPPAGNGKVKVRFVEPGEQLPERGIGENTRTLTKFVTAASAERIHFHRPAGW